VILILTVLLKLLIHIILDRISKSILLFENILGDGKMSKYIMVWDLGTGGNKASLYDEEGNCLVK
jgi:hypothetical protein